jgi:hypothetical protein
VSLEVAAELGPVGEPVVRLERQVGLVRSAVDDVLVEVGLDPDLAGPRRRRVVDLDLERVLGARHGGNAEDDGGDKDGGADHGATIAPSRGCPWNAQIELGAGGMHDSRSELAMAAAITDGAVAARWRPGWRLESSMFEDESS